MVVAIDQRAISVKAREGEAPDGSPHPSGPMHPLCMHPTPCTHAQIFESRLPLQRVSLQNKLGKAVLVDRLPAQ
jgi:hypothetical protein